jgi:hypothetical protein
MSYDEDHYDSEAEESIDWYRHYMSVSAEILAGEYLSRKLRENRKVSEAIEMAAKDRIEEIEDEVYGHITGGDDL